MKGLNNIIENYLNGKTDQELKAILNDLDGAMFEALEEDKKRCEKFIKLAENSDFIEYSSNRVYKKIRG